MTDFTKVSDHELYQDAESVVVTVATTVTLTDPISLNLPHLFVGVLQVDGAGAAALGGAGTYAIEIKTVNSQVWETVSGSPIDATAPKTLNFASNIAAIRATPTGVTSPAISYALLLSGNGH